MPKPHFKAILFDKDGTIFDSENTNKQAWMATTQAHGIDFSEDEYQQFVGMPTQECFAIAKTMFPPDFAWHDFFATLNTKMLNIYASGVPFKRGFEDYFKHIKTLDIPIGLVTSAEREGTELSFKRSGYLKDFDVVITLDEVQRPKPDPQPYLLACEALGVTPEHTLVFEDSNIGLTAAINAGCKTVAIPDLIVINSLIKNQCFAVLSNFDQAYDLL